MALHRGCDIADLMGAVRKRVALVEQRDGSDIVDALALASDLCMICSLA